MPGFISDQTLDQIRAANDIVEVIGSYFPLKRAGANYRALCPFHKEKTPSFNIHPQKQIWHCFGCGAGGDVFAFVMRYENLDFAAAVRRLAERAGIRIETERSQGGPGQSQKDQLYKLHESVAAWFHQNLLTDPSADIARQYLAKRQIHHETVRRWQLGFAPDRWDGLIQWSRAGKQPESLLEQAGLAIRSARGLYDRFRGRLMIPIADEQGRVVAFSGRILIEAKDQPKYVNSPETPIFQKGKLLFGLHKARRAILDEKFVVLCEGQIDTITCHEAGLTNIVAPQGTAFTDHHARILKRYSDDIVLMFDSDAAGQAAAVRNAEPLWELGFAIRVAVLPPGHDPDSFIRKEGIAPMRELIGSAPRFFDFLLDHLSREHDPKTDRGKMQIAQLMAAWLGKAQNPVLRAIHTQETARRLDVPEDVIRHLIKNARQPQHPRVESDANALSCQPPSTDLTETTDGLPAERVLLRVIMADESLLTWVEENLDREWLTNSTAGRLITQTIQLHLDHRWNGPASLFNQPLDADATRLLSNMATRSFEQGSMADAAADCLRALERAWIETRIRDIRGKMRQPGVDLSLSLQFQEELLDLRKRLEHIPAFSTRN